MVLSGPFLTGYTQVGRRHPRAACCPFPEDYFRSFLEGVCRGRFGFEVLRSVVLDGMVCLTPSQLHPPSGNNRRFFLLFFLVPFLIFAVLFSLPLSRSSDQG